MREAAIRNHYLTRLSELLRQIYIRRPSSNTKTSVVHERLSGFIEAALISRTVSNADIQAAVDQGHMKAYGHRSKNALRFSNRFLPLVKITTGHPLTNPRSVDVNPSVQFSGAN